MQERSRAGRCPGKLTCPLGHMGHNSPPRPVLKSPAKPRKLRVPQFFGEGSRGKDEKQAQDLGDCLHTG